MRRIGMRVNVLFQVSTFLLFALGSLVPAHASLMVYTEQATGSGRLGGSSFTNALVTITFVGDTDDVRFRHVSPIPGPIPFLSVSRAPATVNVSGIGTATFTNSIEVACLPIAFGPFVPTTTIGGILGTISLALEGYGLKTPIGPITGSADFRIGAPVPTSLGPFSWDDIAGRMSTFTATPGVVPVETTLSTNPTPASGTVGVTALNDEATLQGENPTGTITFSLFGPPDPNCAGAPFFTQTIPVSGNGTVSTSDGPVANVAGTWQWVVSYSGDAHNSPASSICTDEPVTVNASSSAIPTLSEWGMIMMVALLVWLAMRRMRQAS
jgi:hypothetical protein